MLNFGLLAFFWAGRHPVAILEITGLEIAWCWLSNASLGRPWFDCSIPWKVMEVDIFSFDAEKTTALKRMVF